MVDSHTEGPWRWEFSAESKRVHLVGGRPQFDLTIMDFSRWGMHRVGINLRDVAHNGMNLMHKLHERPDWIAPFPGREHHMHWCANVIHPDMRLIAAAPELLEALRTAYSDIQRLPGHTIDMLGRIEAAVVKATGQST